MPRHYAGPYGHTYFFENGTLYGQPSLASGEFEPNDDEAIPVSEFIEPLTREELEAVLVALAEPCAMHEVQPGNAPGLARLDCEACINLNEYHDFTA